MRTARKIALSVPGSSSSVSLESRRTIPNLYIRPFVPAKGSVVARPSTCARSTAEMWGVIQSRTRPIEMESGGSTLTSTVATGSPGVQRTMSARST